MIFSLTPANPAPNIDRSGDLPSARPFAPVTAAMRPGPPPPSTYSVRRPVVPCTLPCTEDRARSPSALRRPPASFLSRSVAPLRIRMILASRRSPPGPGHRRTRAPPARRGGLLGLFLVLGEVVGLAPPAPSPPRPRRAPRPRTRTRQGLVGLVGLGPRDSARPAPAAAGPPARHRRPAPRPARPGSSSSRAGRRRRSLPTLSSRPRPTVSPARPTVSPTSSPTSATAASGLRSVSARSCRLSLSESIRLVTAAVAAALAASSSSPRTVLTMSPPSTWGPSAPASIGLAEVLGSLPHAMAAELGRASSRCSDRQHRGQAHLAIPPEDVAHADR